MIDITLLVTYHAGRIGVEYESDSFPDWWGVETESEIETEVKQELLEIDSIDQWQTHFETTMEYSPPGASIKPEIGVVSCDEDEMSYSIDITIDSIGELEGF